MKIRAGAKSLMLALTLAAIVVLPAQAHRPGELGGRAPSEPLRTDDLSTSTVHYVELSSDHPRFTTILVAEDPGTNVYLQLGVPAIDRLADYRPILRLFGPSAGQASDTGPELLSLRLPNGQSPESFYEPVTGTESWIHAEATIQLGKPGHYWIVAEADFAKYDKLWVAFGTEERFGIGDLARLPFWVVKVRGFHEVGWGPPWFLAVSSFALLLLLVVLGVGYLRLSRRLRGST